MCREAAEAVDTVGAARLPVGDLRQFICRENTARRCFRVMRHMLRHNLQGAPRTARKTHAANCTAVQTAVCTASFYLVN